MHPPFFVVDHRIDHDILPVEERKLIRRSRPEPLALNLPAPGTPVVIIGAVGPPPPLRPGLLVRLAGLLRAARQRRRTRITGN